MKCQTTPNPSFNLPNGIVPFGVNIDVSVYGTGKSLVYKGISNSNNSVFTGAALANYGDHFPTVSSNYNTPRVISDTSFSETAFKNDRPYGLSDNDTYGMSGIVGKASYNSSGTKTIIKF